MSKREQFLLIGACAAALYGLYATLVPPSAGGHSVTDQAHLAQLKAFTADVDLQVTIRKPTRFEEMLLKLSATRWEKDPFHHGRLPGEDVTEPDETTATAAEPPPLTEPVQPQIKVTYSGYLAAGPRRLAIVNGVQYAEGENLLTAPFAVEKITPEMLTLLNQAGDVRLEIPLESDRDSTVRRE
ncbi:MAG: hypothetical protein HN742_41280 [Lentisphaerae bacterium]|nr:hypothetical protein [Lentisphaerota bacterium]MBT4815449.1 hypothetical protein [Lentisphaerota bacterium]MBT5612722.1 hypothetical protein [Lentisphaerota bacterium]MBT7058951.1 hypothetical protein [Lentisphaerota bacterium]MBT7848371.1 hypothetical protein [Lentisphaerota bacterium]